MSDDNKITSSEYFQIIQCVEYCRDAIRAHIFVSPAEWERLKNLRDKLEGAYNAARKAEK